MASESIDTLELTVKMLPKIEDLLVAFTPDYVDFSKIKKYEDDFNEYQSLKFDDIEKLGMDTIRAYDIATDYQYIASRFAKAAHVLLDKTAATIYLSEAPSILDKLKMKDGADARNKVVDQCDEYIKYKNIRDAWNMLVEWLDNKRQSFLNKHNWVKRETLKLVSERKMYG